jgi:hypothetical protein
VGLANKDSQKHLIFLISEILTMFEGVVTQASAFEVNPGGIVLYFTKDPKSRWQSDRRSGGRLWER